MSQYSEFISNNLFLFAALVAVIAMIVWSEFRRFTRGYKELSATEAVMLMNHDSAVMLDVREDAELAQGTISGSKHLAYSVLRQRVDELKKFKDKPVITFCRSGQRSGMACNILLKNEFTNVYNLKGGVVGWQQANLPLEKK